MTLPRTHPNLVDRFSRRRLLQAGGALTVATAAPACDLLSLNPEDEPAGGGDHVNVEGVEAPSLADRVEQADLPPLEERLPREPVVLEPVDQLGAYGGTWRAAAPSPSMATWVMRQTMAYENLVRWRPNNREFSVDDIIPNVAEGFEANEDGSEYVFHLREGMKWSDGEPFTADDIVFGVDDVLLNTEIFPVPNAILLSNDEVGEVEKIDDYTIRFSFPTPNGSFLHDVASSGGYVLTNYPAHYLKQFHIDHNPDAAELAQDEGLESWPDLFDREAADLENQNRPGVYAWVPAQSLDESTDAVIAERNPFYWKVDTEGRQLPYIDEVRYDIITETETIILRAGSGEIDMQYHFIEALANKPVLAQTSEQGDYDLFDTLSSEMNTTMIALNLTHKDEALRDIFSAKDFRVGLSHAINREQIIELVYQRQGEAWQGAPRRESPYFSEEMAKQFTEFDLDEANRYLDMVVPDKDDQGHRLRPDGERLFFQIDTRIGSEKAEWPDVIELVREHWAAVGMQCEMNTMDDSLWDQRKNANEYDASVHHGDGGLDVELLLRWYAPVDTWGSLFGLPWSRWFHNPDDETGEEPPPIVRDQLELVRELEATFNLEQRAELVQEILGIAHEQFWAMGVTLNPPGFGVVRNNFRNTPDTIFASWNAGSVAGSNSTQFWIDQG